MKLTARRNRTAPVPAWDVFRQGMKIPCYRISSERTGWRVTAVPGPYGTSEEDQEDACWMSHKIADRGPRVSLHEALTVVRNVIEIRDELHRQEAMAER